MNKEASKFMHHGEGLLQIVEDLHMNANGSSDRLLYEDRMTARYTNAVKAALQHWQPNDSAYDNAVRSLLEAVADEIGLYAYK